MRVHEASDGLCLATKLLHSVASQPHLQDFDGGFSLQMNMLAEIHIGVATLSNQTDQAIVADLLSHTIFHFPLLGASSQRKTSYAPPTGRNLYCQHCKAIYFSLILVTVCAKLAT